MNPDIHWDTEVWHWCTRTDAEDRPIHLVSVGAFVAMMCAEHTQGYKLHLHKTDQFFLDANSESMPSHCPHDLGIELLNGKQPSWGPINNLLEKELDALRSYPKVQLIRSWIRPLKSPARAPVFIMPKKDGTLRL